MAKLMNIKFLALILKYVCKKKINEKILLSINNYVSKHNVF